MEVFFKNDLILDVILFFKNTIKMEVCKILKKHVLNIFLQEEIKSGYKDYVTEDENTIFVEKVNISIHFLSDQMSLKVRGNKISCSYGVF